MPRSDQRRCLSAVTMATSACALTFDTPIACLFCTLMLSGTHIEKWVDGNMREWLLIVTTALTLMHAAAPLIVYVTCCDKIRFAFSALARIHTDTCSSSCSSAGCRRQRVRCSMDRRRRRQWPIRARCPWPSTTVAADRRCTTTVITWPTRSHHCSLRKIRRDRDAKRSFERAMKRKSSDCIHLSDTEQMLPIAQITARLLSPPTATT